MIKSNNKRKEKGTIGLFMQEERPVPVLTAKICHICTLTTTTAINAADPGGESV